MIAAKKSDYPLKWYDPAVLSILPPVAGWIISAMMRSCRLTGVFGQDAVKDALDRSGGKAVYATWHQRMFYHFYFFGRMNLIMMISGSRDGEYAARLASCLGFRNVRGSSTRGGSKALKDMMARLKSGHGSAGMLADGPQGPPRVIKIGSLIMARDTGFPLIGVLWGCDNCWVLNSWDRYLIPKPFSHVVIAYTEPMWIPPKATGPELDFLRLEFENRLNEATRLCDLRFGAERPWRRVKNNDQAEIGPL